MPGVPGTYRATERGSGHPPGNYMGLMGQEGDRPAPRGAGAPHVGQSKGEERGEERKEGEQFGLPLPSLLPPPSFLPRVNMEGGRPNWQVPNVGVKTGRSRVGGPKLCVKPYVLLDCI